MSHNIRPETLQKVRRMTDAISERGSILIAFSGGVDSSVLAYVARQSGANTLAVTVDSELLGHHGLRHAQNMADEIGIEHIIIKFDILKRKEFTENPHDRCYYCKKYLIAELTKIASQNEIETIADGTNITDIAGHRPGYDAIKESGVFTPFINFMLKKPEIREIAGYYGLSVADTPSESCFATRIPYDTEITIQRLARIEKAESILHAHGLDGVRVRDHDWLACIEVQSHDVEWFMLLREDVEAAFRKIGFDRVVLSRIRML